MNVPKDLLSQMQKVRRTSSQSHSDGMMGPPYKPNSDMKKRRLKIGICEIRNLTLKRLKVEKPNMCHTPRKPLPILPTTKLKTGSYLLGNQWDVSPGIIGTYGYM